MVTIKSESEIELMRQAGKVAARCLDDMLKLVRVGATPVDIDMACRKWSADHGVIPAPLNYKKFPASLCVSVNDVVCHGIPDKRKFKDGDIVNLDVTPIVNGFHGDINATVIVGKPNPKMQRLLDVAYQSMWAGIHQVKPRASLGDIGHAIQTCVEGAGFSVVEEFCGHGIGRIFHEDPHVVHVGKPGVGMKIRPGMTFTIEPMINFGKRNVFVEKDGWTVRTQDGSMSAQFEHTILVTETGYEVLTLREGEVDPR